MVFDWLAGQPEVQPDRIAVMGFCYGGGKALQYSLHADQVAATGIFYGSLVTDADVLRKLPGPVLGIFGAEDQSIPVAEVRAFEAALNEAGVPNQITIYDGVGHAFVSDMETIEAGGAPGAAWAELLSFLEETTDYTKEPLSLSSSTVAPQAGKRLCVCGHSVLLGLVSKSLLN